MNKLSEDEQKILMLCLIKENCDLDLDDNDLPFLSQVIKKRIDVLKLPLKYTNTFLVAINAFAKNPGQAVLLLIDCLTKHENELVKASTLCNLYPSGFYADEQCMQIIDNEIKTGKRKWSHIY